MSAAAPTTDGRMATWRRLAKPWHTGGYGPWHLMRRVRTERGVGIDFPAVASCGVNMFRRSKLDQQDNAAPPASDKVCVKCRRSAEQDPPPMWGGNA